jgi:hypothetical protein
VTLRVYVDWNNDGVYEETITNKVWSVEVVRGRDVTSSVFGSSVISSCSIELTNDSGEYSPPLNPTKQPGAPVRVTVQRTGGSEVDVFVGRIATIEVSPTADIPQKAVLRCDGILSRVANAVNDYPPDGFSTRGSGDPVGSQIATILFDMVGIGFPNFTGDVGLRRAADVAGNSVSALELIRALEQLEGAGWLYEKSDGTLRFDNATKRVLPKTPLYSFTDNPSGIVIKNAKLLNVYDGIKNRVNTQEPVREYFEGLIGSWSGSLRIPALESRSIEFSLDGVPYSASATQAFLVVEGSNYSSSVSLRGADRVLVTVTNTGSSTPIRLTSVKVFGRALKRSGGSTLLSQSTASISRHGIREASIDTRFVVSARQLEALAAWVVSRYSNPLYVVEVELKPFASQAHFDACFGVELNNPVSLTSSRLGFTNATMFVEKIVHRLSKTDWSTTLTLSQPPSQDTGFWTLGTSALGSTTKVWF